MGGSGVRALVYLYARARLCVRVARPCVCVTDNRSEDRLFKRASVCVFVQAQPPSSPT